MPRASRFLADSASDDVRSWHRVDLSDQGLHGALVRREEYDAGRLRDAQGETAGTCGHRPHMAVGQAHASRFVLPTEGRLGYRAYWLV